MKYVSDLEIISRVQKSSFLERFKEDYFAQNWYAAFCNNDFSVDGDSTKQFSLSWRSSGGFVADIRNQLGFSEDYINWYCSGLTAESEIMGRTVDPVTKYVGEGRITDEIGKCLAEIGLEVIPGDVS